MYQSIQSGAMAFREVSQALCFAITKGVRGGEGGLADREKRVLSPALVQSVDQRVSPPLSSPASPPLRMEMLHSEILVRGLPSAESHVELCSPLL